MLSAMDLKIYVFWQQFFLVVLIHCMLCFVMESEQRSHSTGANSCMFLLAKVKVVCPYAWFGLHYLQRSRLSAPYAWFGLHYFQRSRLSVLKLGLVYTTRKGQGCLPLMLGLVYTNHFSSIAMEAVLHTKQQSNLLLEPTSTAQWGLTFYLKETTGTLVGFKLTATHHYKTDTIQPLRHAAQSFGNLSHHCRVQSTAISNWLHITVLYSTLILFHPYLYQLKQLG